MKKLFVLLISLITIVSCTDLTGIENRLDEYEDRLLNLEILCDHMNDNIASLEALVSALENKDYVTDVSSIFGNDGSVIGYRISFSKSSPIKIYDGKDGNTPQIGLKKDNDGVYYWTLDGIWMKDDSGSKIKANGPDGAAGPSGQDGADGLTPELKIEEGYWWVRYGRESWKRLGKATGENGDSFFKSIDNSNADYLKIVLADGTEMMVPKWKSDNLEVTFSSKENIFCEAGMTVTVNFTVKGTEKFKVDCLGENGWNASVEIKGNGGKLMIKAPEPYVNGKILVFVSDSKGRVAVNSLTFTDQILAILSGDAYKVKSKSSQLDINVKTTVGYTVQISSDATGWLHQITTKGNAREEIVSFIVDENKLYRERSGMVKLIADKGNIIREFTVVQEGEVAPCTPVDLGLSVEWASANLGADSPENRGKLYLWGDPKDEGVNGMYDAPAMNNICGTAYDAATYLLGDGWRLPNRQEQRELIFNCRWVRTTVNGISCMKVVGPNGNSIILPLTGIGFPSSGPAYQDNTQIVFKDQGCFWVGESYVQSYGGSTSDSRMAYVFYFNPDSYYYDGSYNTSASRIAIRPVHVRK